MWHFLLLFLYQRISPSAWLLRPEIVLSTYIQPVIKSYSVFLHNVSYNSLNFHPSTTVFNLNYYQVAQVTVVALGQLLSLGPILFRKWACHTFHLWVLLPWVSPSVSPAPVHRSGTEANSSWHSSLLISNLCPSKYAHTYPPHTHTHTNCLMGKCCLGWGAQLVRVSSSHAPHQSTFKSQPMNA